MVAIHVATVVVLLFGSVACQCYIRTNSTAVDTPELAIHNNSICSVVDEDSSCCPPWQYPNRQTCKCGNNHQNAVKCENVGNMLTTFIRDCYCMTYDTETNETYLGACFFNCFRHDYSGDLPFGDKVYHQLAVNRSQLNQAMCDIFNRKGSLCGECKQNHSLLSYSFNMNCVHCPDGRKNWWKFILAAYLPLTVFIFLVLFFKIEVTSPNLHGFVIFSQVLFMPVMARFLFMFKIAPHEKNFLLAIKLLGVLYGIWNLDFFRTVLPDICLGQNSLLTIALEYTIALYPLVLIIFSYGLIELHDRNVRIIVFIWKPFRCVFTLFRRNWDIKTTVLDAYVTFFLLSFIKIVSVSADLLIFVKRYTLNSSKVTLVLYYNGNIEYFGHEHWPYGVLAICMLICFVFLPILILSCYPFHFFQRFLSRLPIRMDFLHAFVFSFQKCYKDGTVPGTHDCRWFSVSHLVGATILFIIFALTLDLMFFAAASIFILFLYILIAIVQPFKTVYYQKIYSFFVLWIILLYSTLATAGLADIRNVDSVNYFLYIVWLIVLLPIVYISFVVVYWFFSRRKFGVELVQRVKAWKHGYEWWTLDSVTESSLPDRMQHPDLYDVDKMSM